MAHVANITIDNTKVAGDLTDFPVYVDLADMPAVFWSTVANGGGDIRVYKSDGTTELPREVVSCDTSTETGELHVKYTGTLSSSVDTEIQIHADGTSSDYATTDTYGAENVWSDYVFVGHSEDASGNMFNSTGNGDLTVSGTPVYGATGQLGDAITYDGSTDYFSGTPTGADTTEPVSVQAWIKPTVKANQTVIGLWGSAAGSQMGILIDDSGATYGTPIAYAGGQSVSASSDLDGTLQMLHAVFASDTSRTIYVDGSSAGSNTNSTSVSSTTTLTVGRRYNDQYFTGDIDEARLRNSALSANWITTEYNNQNSPSTFYTATAPGLDLGLGTFTITGNDITTRLYSTLSLDLGEFTLTGNDITTRYSGWTNLTKNSSSWTDASKNSSSWTDVSKNGSSWTNES